MGSFYSTNPHPAVKTATQTFLNITPTIYELDGDYRHNNNTDGSFGTLKSSSTRYFLL